MPILRNNKWAYSGSQEDETPKYDDCIKDIFLASYATVAVIAFFSEAGVCLVTHDKLQAPKFTVLTEKIESKLEKEKFSKLLEHNIRFFRSNTKLEGYDTSKYAKCQTTVSFDETLQKLFIDNQE